MVDSCWITWSCRSRAIRWRSASMSITGVSACGGRARRDDRRRRRRVGSGRVRRPGRRACAGRGRAPRWRQPARRRGRVAGSPAGWRASRLVSPPRWCRVDTVQLALELWIRIAAASASAVARLLSSWSSAGFGGRSQRLFAAFRSLLGRCPSIESTATADPGVGHDKARPQPCRDW